MTASVPLSDADLAAIEARANAATPGPWVLSQPEGNWIWPHVCNTYGSSRADAEFIAAAREDVPKLIAALAAERRRADEAEVRLARLGRAFTTEADQ